MVCASPVLRNISHSYSKGKKREDVVSDILRLRGYNVCCSSYHEDFHDDIDIWVNQHSVSIKAPRKWYPNLCLEYYAVKRDGSKLTSWFITSKAKYLALLQPDDSLTIYDFAKLRKFMATCDVPFTSLSPQLVTKNEKTLSPDGKPYTFVDAWNKNVPLNTLKECEVTLDGH